MGKDKYVKVGHVIAGHNNRACGWNIFSAFPITFHQHVENRNDQASPKFEGAICAKWITTGRCIRDLKLRHI
jgi:hypothetical protein